MEYPTHRPQYQQQHRIFLRQLCHLCLFLTSISIFLPLSIVLVNVYHGERPTIWWLKPPFVDPDTIERDESILRRVERTRWVKLQTKTAARYRINAMGGSFCSDVHSHSRTGSSMMFPTGSSIPSVLEPWVVDATFSERGAVVNVVLMDRYRCSFEYSVWQQAVSSARYFAQEDDIHDLDHGKNASIYVSIPMSQRSNPLGIVTDGVSDAAAAAILAAAAGSSSSLSSSPADGGRKRRPTGVGGSNPTLFYICKYYGRKNRPIESVGSLPVLYGNLVRCPVPAAVRTVMATSEEKVSMRLQLPYWPKISPYSAEYGMLGVSGQKQHQNQHHGYSSRIPGIGISSDLRRIGRHYGDDEPLPLTKIFGVCPMPLLPHHSMHLHAIPRAEAETTKLSRSAGKSLVGNAAAGQRTHTRSDGEKSLGGDEQGDLRRDRDRDMDVNNWRTNPNIGFYHGYNNKEATVLFSAGAQHGGIDGSGRSNTSFINSAIHGVGESGGSRSMEGGAADSSSRAARERNIAFNRPSELSRGRSPRTAGNAVVEKAPERARAGAWKGKGKGKGKGKTRNGGKRSVSIDRNVLFHNRERRLLESSLHINGKSGDSNASGSFSDDFDDDDDDDDEWVIANARRARTTMKGGGRALFGGVQQFKDRTRLKNSQGFNPKRKEKKKDGSRTVGVGGSSGSSSSGGLGLAGGLRAGAKVLHRHHLYDVSVCSAMSAPFSSIELIEWIEYHRMMGVDHFFLYDTTHDTSQWRLDRLNGGALGADGKPLKVFSDHTLPAHRDAASIHKHTAASSSSASEHYPETRGTFSTSHQAPVTSFSVSQSNGAGRVSSPFGENLSKKGASHGEGMTRKSSKLSAIHTSKYSPTAQILTANVSLASGSSGIASGTSTGVGAGYFSEKTSHLRGGSDVSAHRHLQQHHQQQLQLIDQHAGLGAVAGSEVDVNIGPRLSLQEQESMRIRRSALVVEGDNRGDTYTDMSAAAADTVGGDGREGEGVGKVGHGGKQGPVKQAPIFGFKFGDHSGDSSADGALSKMRAQQLRLDAARRSDRTAQQHSKVLEEEEEKERPVVGKKLKSLLQDYIAMGLVTVVNWPYASCAESMRCEAPIFIDPLHKFVSSSPSLSSSSLSFEAGTAGSDEYGVKNSTSVRRNGKIDIDKSQTAAAAAAFESTNMFFHPPKPVYSAELSCFHRFKSTSKWMAMLGGADEFIGLDVSKKLNGQKLESIPAFLNALDSVHHNLAAVELQRAFYLPCGELSDDGFQQQLQKQQQEEQQGQGQGQRERWSRRRQLLEAQGRGRDPSEGISQPEYLRPPGRDHVANSRLAQVNTSSVPAVSASSASASRQRERGRDHSRADRHQEAERSRSHFHEGHNEGEQREKVQEDTKWEEEDEDENEGRVKSGQRARALADMTDENDEDEIILPRFDSFVFALTITAVQKLALSPTLSDAAASDVVTRALSATSSPTSSSTSSSASAFSPLLSLSNEKDKRKTSEGLDAEQVQQVSPKGIARVKRLYRNYMLKVSSNSISRQQLQLQQQAQHQQQQHAVIYRTDKVVAFKPHSRDIHVEFFEPAPELLSSSAYKNLPSLVGGRGGSVGDGIAASNGASDGEETEKAKEKAKNADGDDEHALGLGLSDSSHSHRGFSAEEREQQGRKQGGGEEAGAADGAELKENNGANNVGDDDVKNVNDDVEEYYLDDDSDDAAGQDDDDEVKYELAVQRYEKFRNRWPMVASGLRMFGLYGKPLRSAVLREEARKSEKAARKKEQEQEKLLKQRQKEGISTGIVLHRRLVGERAEAEQQPRSSSSAPSSSTPPTTASTSSSQTSSGSSSSNSITTDNKTKTKSSLGTYSNSGSSASSPVLYLTEAQRLQLEYSEHLHHSKRLEAKKLPSSLVTEATTAKASAAARAQFLERARSFRESQLQALRRGDESKARQQQGAEFRGFGDNMRAYYQVAKVDHTLSRILVYREARLSVCERGTTRPISLQELCIPLSTASPSTSAAAGIPVPISDSPKTTTTATQHTAVLHTAFTKKLKFSLADRVARSMVCDVPQLE